MGDEWIEEVQPDQVNAQELLQEDQTLFKTFHKHCQKCLGDDPFCDQLEIHLPWDISFCIQRLRRHVWSQQPPRKAARVNIRVEKFRD
jgi:hypothetical protein